MNELAPPRHSSAELSQLSPDQLKEHTSSLLRSWNEATGGMNRKSRSYGRGSLAHSGASTSSSPSCTSYPPEGYVSVQEFNEVREKNDQLERTVRGLEDRMSSFEEYMRRCGTTREHSRARDDPDDDDDDDDQHHIASD